MSPPLWSLSLLLRPPLGIPRIPTAQRSLTPPFHQNSQLASLSPVPHCYFLRARALSTHPSFSQMLNKIPGKVCQVPKYEPNALGAFEKDLVLE